MRARVPTIAADDPLVASRAVVVTHNQVEMVQKHVHAPGREGFALPKYDRGPPSRRGSHGDSGLEALQRRMTPPMTAQVPYLFRLFIRTTNRHRGSRDR